MCMNNDYKVAIVGGRDFTDYKRVVDDMDTLRTEMDFPGIVIICGEARGADLLGRRYAEELGFKVESFPAKWGEHGKSAGYRRNIDMAVRADCVLAYWDGVSKGTKHMIDITKKKGKQLRIRSY